MRRQRAIRCGLGGRPQPSPTLGCLSPCMNARAHRQTRAHPNTLGLGTTNKNHCVHLPAGAVADDEVHCARGTNMGSGGAYGPPPIVKCQTRSCVAHFYSTGSRCWCGSGGSGHGREPAAWKEEKTEGRDENYEEANCGEAGPLRRP